MKLPLLLAILLCAPVLTRADENFATFQRELSRCLERPDQRCIMQYLVKDSLTARGKFRCRKEDPYQFSQKELIRCLEKLNGELKSTITDCLNVSQAQSPRSPYFVHAYSSATTCIFQHLEGKWRLGQVLLREE